MVSAVCGKAARTVGKKHYKKRIGERREGISMWPRKPLLFLVALTITNLGLAGFDGLIVWYLKVAEQQREFAVVLQVLLGATALWMIISTALVWVVTLRMQEKTGESG